MSLDNAQQQELVRQLNALRAQTDELNRTSFTHKMDALARLSGGVAHDLNNMLTIVFGYCDFLLEHVQPDGALHAYLSEIKHAGEQASNLTRLLMVFGARRVFQPVVMNLNAIIKMAEPHIREILGSAVSLNVNLTRDRCIAKVEPYEIERVFTNLASNARDAMPNGGEFTITTSIIDGSATSDESPGGRCILISVRDTGCGMDDAMRSHVFEPFFTTKNMATNMGLGLFAAYAIARQSDGAITCESAIGAGTTFTLLLPLADLPHAAAIEPSAKKPALAKQATLLVCEDDIRVRSLMRKILEPQGYRIIEAANGQQALELIEAGQTADLLLTDVVMPIMNGRELGERALAVLPNLRVLYTSGYTEDDLLRDKVLNFNAQFVQKPFTPQKLREKVREALAG